MENMRVFLRTCRVVFYLAIWKFDVNNGARRFGTSALVIGGSMSELPRRRTGIGEVSMRIAAVC